jgi:orotidine-5'-phosphate decarboxylase|tara:strand:+ start:1130 stop:2014 length:885 start_codon:yes stop_codon:yes gene_type:complete
MGFREKWLEAVETKNSVLCAGLDPAEFDMGRREKGLSKDEDKLNWSTKYIDAVAPFVAAIKPNSQYWRGLEDSSDLRVVRDHAKERGLIIIDDSKLADIGSTNDAGMFFSKDLGADAVTLAPYGGNIKEAARQAHHRGLGIIGMCLMSNPEYEREKNMLVRLNDEEQRRYEFDDLIFLGIDIFVPRYIQLAYDSHRYGLDGIVVGAPSSENHITEKELSNVAEYIDHRMLVLSPGVGAQGGEAKALWKYFGKNKVIVNVGRALMFPDGSNSSPEDQAVAAESYMGMLNELRAAA